MKVTIDREAFWDYLIDEGFSVMADKRYTPSGAYYSQNLKSATIMEDGTVTLDFSRKHQEGCDKITFKGGRVLPDKFKKKFARVYKRYKITMSDASSSEMLGLHTAMEFMDIDKEDFTNFVNGLDKELSTCKTCGGELISLSYIRCPHCGCNSEGMWGNLHSSE